MLGLNKEEVARLISLQLEYNIRQMKIIEKMEQSYDNDSLKDKESSSG